MVRWLRWHCPPDTGLEIRALAVWGRARYLSVTEAPHNTNFHTWMGKKQFCYFQTAETGNRTPDSGVKGSGANHYPRTPAHFYARECKLLHNIFVLDRFFIISHCFIIRPAKVGQHLENTELIFPGRSWRLWKVVVCWLNWSHKHL